jgi:hypothetical protein
VSLGSAPSPSPEVCSAVVCDGGERLSEKLRLLGGVQTAEPQGRQNDLDGVGRPGARAGKAASASADRHLERV